MSHTTSTSSKNTHTITNACAHVHESPARVPAHESPARVPAHDEHKIPPPTLEQAVSMAENVMGFTDKEFIREWYEDMSMSFWCDSYGRPLRNWGRTLCVWIRNKALFKAKRDPNRVQPIGVSRGSYQDRKVAEAEALEAKQHIEKTKKFVTAVKALTPEDWALCAESGCINFIDGKCSKCALPCSHMLNKRPCQPTECYRYTPNERKN